MALSLNPRLRALLIVGLLALAALAAGVMVLGRAQPESEAAPKPSGERPAAPRTQQAPAPKPAPAPQAEGDRLPVAITEALAANRVVVVSLYTPKAKVDTLAMREASAGAALAGAIFVAVDVSTSQVDSLSKRYGVLHDPAVLVLRPPGDLIVRIDGFADRDTVAQAAANAAA